MAVDFWASRPQDSKNLSAVQAAHHHDSESRLAINETEGDDVRAWFPCPFCYVEIEVPVFCTHLQEEHCFDLKNAVCPICAANLGKDAIGHFVVQHAHSVKRRRKSRKSGLWSVNTPMSGKEMREMSSFLGSNSVGKRYSCAQESAPDPVLAPFIWNDVSISSIQEDQQKPERNAISVPDCLGEEDWGERRQRAAFFQELMFSTIL